MEESEPRVADHYDDLAEAWADIVDSPSRRELLWPALEAMLPSLTGRRVLDAGCGSGVYTERLVDGGAEVLGVDVSETMVREASERIPEATFRRADLGVPLDFLADGSVDVVLCQHVFSHLPELRPTLQEFARVLVDGGVLVVSTHNPVHDYLVVRDATYSTAASETAPESTVETSDERPTYAETERYDIHWNPGPDANRGTYYRRSISALFTPLLDAGLTVDRVVEPVPDEAFTQEYPDVAAAFEGFPPRSICIRATT